MRRWVNAYSERVLLPAADSEIREGGTTASQELADMILHDMILILHDMILIMHDMTMVHDMM